MGEWLTFPTIRDGVLFALALYGAVLSTFNLVQGVRKEQRRIRMRTSHAAPTYGAQVGPWYLKVEATNTGQRHVTIKTVTLELAPGVRLFSMHPNAMPGMPDTLLPITLTDGQTAHVFFSYTDIATALANWGRKGKTKLRPICEDSAGGMHKGPRWKVDFNALLRQGKSAG